MKQLSSAQVRQMWLDFWATKGHSVEPSVSLVPVNDPTLLWINSGVATLKKYFDGTIIPENPRITNAQKAIRTNDIENVGKTKESKISDQSFSTSPLTQVINSPSLTSGEP
ncbi:alanyl-tRNA synthetase [Streptococcus pneumoniae]|nr:alanyl-tRNA synthetase [Streptococcus pneumoniae]